MIRIYLPILAVGWLSAVSADSQILRKKNPFAYNPFKTNDDTARGNGNLRKHATTAKLDDDLGIGNDSIGNSDDPSDLVRMSASESADASDAYAYSSWWLRKTSAREPGDDTERYLSVDEMELAPATASIDALPPAAPGSESVDGSRTATTRMT